MKTQLRIRMKKSTCTCQLCGREVQCEDIKHTDIGDICGDCNDEAHCSCSECHEVFWIDEMHQHEDGYMCHDCWTAMGGKNARKSLR